MVLGWRVMFVCPECGAAAAAAGACTADGTGLRAIGEDLLLGTTLGSYRVASLIGVGGMGRVYKGVQPTIGSRVAIKVLSRECSDRPDLVQRFFAEAKAVNLIRHESIVNVLDLAMLPDGRPYIVMEFLDGCALSDLITPPTPRGPLPLGGVARLLAEVLDALGAAHAKGIVHRDLKPDNIFITPGGRPKVLDFGIAKLTDAGGGVSSSTRTGSLLGTPHYMAPEQANGRPVDHRADLYALGVILFECATGRRPFAAKTLFDLLRKHVDEPPPSPRSLRPDLPIALEQVILVALAKSPDQRFGSAQAMSHALQQASASVPPEQWTPLVPTASITARPAGWAPPLPASWGPTEPAVHSSGQVPSSPPGQAPSSPPGQAPSYSPTDPSSPPPTHPATAHPTQPDGPPTVAAPGSRLGLWFALGALALVGVGITAAVVAPGTPASSSNGAAEASVSAPSALAAGGPSVASPPATPASPPVVASPPPVDAAAPPADARPTVADLKAQRAADPEGTQIAEALPPTPAPLPPTPAPLPPTARADGWFERHPVKPPVDLTRLDVDRFITWSIAEARRTVPDAALTRVDVDAVAVTGKANLALGNGGSIDVRFRSAARAKLTSGLPRGTSGPTPACAFRIAASPGDSEIYETSGPCTEEVVPAPRCSIAQVWSKALALQPDLADAVADITYTRNIVNHRVVWMFSITDNGTSLISEQFPDDC